MKSHTVDLQVNENSKLVENALLGLESLIQLCGDDPNRDGLIETPSRVLRAFLEYTAGYQEDPKDHLTKVFDINYQDIVLIRDIEVHSMCEHHFAPFYGVVHIGYIPRSYVTGLSKIARMVEGYARRFQVQERFTEEIVTAIEDMLEPEGVMAVVSAKHMCMCGRGIRKSGATTITKSTRGIFQSNEIKQNEFMYLLQSSITNL
ncbi:GTP cyclohydrolase I FolE [Paenibacillus polymyxa]|uniref:GTP cyclohydrolase I FolE n=1 Tax=Paenibacillus polymyxa TaxID=1406 RepID=UPI001BE5385F|nr:GTP cyclohydrolase I FolE [Paenibacillus polymyxa]MBT2282954.1 GTP cyclohydrolase I FolE [Paenibacillus polymyxa]